MAFREGGYSCPACRARLVQRGSVLACNGCGGAWLGEGDVLERVRVVRGKSEFELSLAFAPAQMEPTHKRACPICQKPLSTMSLGGVDVDRCLALHGIWFDAKELQTALLAATEGVGVVHMPGALDGTSRDASPDGEGDLLGIIGGLLGP